MKKTVTVNLNGSVFTIDEDAYLLLDKYLKNLRICFQKEEGSAEILADFEARIEELFSARLRLGYSVITIDDVEKVMAQVGRPDEFGTQESEESDAHVNEPTGDAKRKFFRNPDDRMFGGVCSGMAAYFKWDVTAVRIILVILALLPIVSFPWIILAYLIVWIVTPEAKTVAQKLEMQGKAVTVENIGKTISAGIEEVSATVKNSGCLKSVVEIIVAFMKICLVGVGLIVGIPLLFLLFIVIVVMIAVVCGFGWDFSWLPFTWFESNVISIAVFSACLVLALPVIALLYAIASYCFKWKPVNKWVKWSGIIIWFIALASLIISGTQIPFRSMIRDLDWHYEYNIRHDYSDAVYGNGTMGDREDIFPAIRHLIIEDLVMQLNIEQTKGDSTVVVINGDNNLLHLIEAEYQSDGSLRLDVQENTCIETTTPLLVSIKTPDLQTLKLKSVEDVRIDRAFRSDKLSINMDGFGKLTADSLYCRDITIGIKGICSAEVQGQARQARYTVQGAGSIQAQELSADSVYARIDGVGEIQCDPRSYLDGAVKGMGNISYKKEPAHKTVWVTGLGKIKRY
ncbi:MAG: DUF2807 domain-containing protein [Candidatus Symbiothrix sp.]|jgi:phage shock protein PspC (stress-responsive transcriptional regulator)|nr:DUF2807 domain-containing protein [Candidatus Symbiothrix sp.]